MDAARRLLARLAARPRPAGSAAEREAREHCAGALRALGFHVAEEPFVYSAAPGRLGTPLGGLASMLMVGAAAYAGARGAAGTALGILAVGGSALALAARWLATRGVLALPWWRERGTNLVATRGEPSLWLVAHLDSKSQPVPIALRALGVMGTLLVWGVALVVALAQLLAAGGGAGPGAELAAAWPWIAAAAAAAGAPVAASVVRARSPGAVDDASGVATVLGVAAALPAARALGVLLTSAEELGLAGARAWARGRAGGTAINVDGVDDAGAVRLTWTRRAPVPLMTALLHAARSERLRASTGRLPPGVLVDGVALADRGWSVVTVSRGSWRTVARVHTPRDAVTATTGAGIPDVVRTIARALDEAR